jgi:hypothetical protein
VKNELVRREGIPRVVCQEKHMGSRAVVVICRDDEVARKRFGVVGEGSGACVTRSLALREFALGIEGLERFVRRKPLRRVHECAFAVLALESEPVDPRL